MSSVQWSVTGKLLVAVSAFFILYIVYTYLLGSGASYHQHHGETWKDKHTHREMPDITHRHPEVKIEEKYADVTIKYNQGTSQLKLFYRDASPIDARGKEAPVVFLHGMGDSSKNWLDIGSLHMVALMGHRAIAVDLPDHGHSSKSPGVMNLETRREILEAFLHAANVEKPILVPASMGGSYALPYLMDPKPETCHKRVAGFVPIAIVSTDKYTAPKYHKCHVPTMIVFGVNDTHLGLNAVGNLRNLANNEITVIQKAGHACMHEQPKVWNEHLYNFLHATKFKP